jgi:hypothetical protein
MIRGNGIRGNEDEAVPGNNQTWQEKGCIDINYW